MKAQEKRERQGRRRAIAMSTAVAWESLRTHLSSAVKTKEKDSNERWHSQSCLDYGFIIHTLVRELHEMNKEDFPDKFEAANGEI
jgi:hypothetical protein